MQLIKDIIELPEIKTVIQLSDLQDEQLKRFLADSFVLTQDVTFGLNQILGSISNGKGAGCFIHGNFGSGKSHFLTVLSLLFSYIEAWEPVIRQNQGFERLRAELVPKKFIVLNISLIEHGAREFLEEILSKELSNTLKQQSLNLTLRKGSRKETFETLKNELQDEGINGLVILIDELSEFLRSKPDSRSFNEDIRFLQFLGEAASGFPLWVVATLQERIEETGEITQDVFNKIKDRFPLRLSLGSGHIEELVSARLVKKKPGTEQVAGELFNQIKEAFPTFPFPSDLFVKLYPVHPYTITLLDNLKVLFSQQRGVVDFIHYQLKGDPSRKTDGILHLPVNCLLTPDTIFDHFRYRIKEMVETNSFHDIVFKYYEDEMKTLFPDETERGLAFKMVKILILLAITPIRKRYNIKQITEMLLYKVTDLESGINYQYVRGIMDHMYREGSYIALNKGKDELDDCFSIDLKLDINILVKEKTEYIEKSLFEEERRLFDHLISLADDRSFPVASLYKEEKSKRAVKWQHTLREGYVVLTQVDELLIDTIDALSSELLEAELDFCLILGTTYRGEKQETYIRETLFPHVSKVLPDSFLVWLPARIQNDTPLRHCLSHLLLMNKYRDDDTEMGKRIKQYLKGVLEQEKTVVKEIFLRAYFEGRIYSDRAEEGIRLQQMRHLPFEQLLGELMPEVLSKKYPRHMDIYPSAEVLTKNNLQEVIDLFLRPGETRVDKRLQYGLVNTIEGFMEPMGLIKKTASSYSLIVDPRRNKFVQHFLSFIPEERIKLEELYQKMRKGEYGLCRNQFDLLILSSFFTGQLTPLSRGRKKPLDQINAYYLNIIDQVEKAEVLSASLQELLVTLPFMPARIKKGEFSYYLQEDAWNVLKSLKEEWKEAVEDVRFRLERFSDYRALSHLEQGKILKDLEKVSQLAEEIKISYPSREGLKRFLEACSSDPSWESSFERVRRLREFLSENLERYLFIYEYLHDQGLNIPDQEPYQFLKAKREEVKDLLKDSEGIYHDSHMDSLKEKFEAFHREYVLLYQKEHQRLFQNDRMLSLNQVRDSKRYNLLKKLSELNFISVKNDRIKVDRLVSSVLVKLCTDFYVSALHQRPTCRCGFKLGDSLEAPPREEIEALIVKGIMEYIEALNSPQVHEKILPFIIGLEDVKRQKDAERIRALINFSVNNGNLAASIDPLSRLLDPPLVDAINEAMSGKAVIVERNLDELYENIIDRNFTRKRLEEIFSEWLDSKENVDDGTYIRVTTGKRSYAAQAEEASKLKEVIEQRFPELAVLSQSMGEKDFSLLAWTTRWLHQHDISHKRIEELVSFSSRKAQDEWERVRKSLLQLCSYLIEQVQDTAASLIKETEASLISSEKKEDFLNLLSETYGDKDLLLILKNERTFSFPLKWALERLWRVISTRARAISLQDLTLFIEEEKKSVFLPSVLKKIEHLICLKDYLELYTSLEYLKKFDDARLRDYKDWERLYLKYLAKLPYLYSASYERMQLLQCLDEILMREKKKTMDETFSRLENKFSDFYQNSHSLWNEREVKRPFFMRDIAGNLRKKYARTFNEHPIKFILLDGMRWDLWCFLKEQFFSSLKDSYRLVDEIPLWAHSPTVTSVQVEDLLGLSSSSTGKEVSLKAAEENDMYKGQWESRLQLSDGDKIYVNRFIDGKVHTSRDSLFAMFQEIKQYLKSSLEARMDALPKRSLIFLFSDHGFKNNPRFTMSDKYREARYVHGSSSFWEVIVPLGVFLKT